MCTKKGPHCSQRIQTTFKRNFPTETHGIEGERREGGRIVKLEHTLKLAWLPNVRRPKETNVLQARQAVIVVPKGIIEVGDVIGHFLPLENGRLNAGSVVAPTVQFGHLEIGQGGEQNLPLGPERIDALSKVVSLEFRRERSGVH